MVVEGATESLFLLFTLIDGVSADGCAGGPCA